MVGRVWPRHGHRGRPLNSVVRRHLDAASQQISLAHCAGGRGRRHISRLLHLGAMVDRCPNERGSIGGGGAASRWLPGCFSGSRHVVVSVAWNRRIESLGFWSMQRDRSWRLGISYHQQFVRPRVPRKERQMTSNNTFERTVRHGGPRLAAALSSWPAAQLGR
jgi:hypothetical protein